MDRESAIRKLLEYQRDEAEERAARTELPESKKYYKGEASAFHAAFTITGYSLETLEEINKRRQLQNKPLIF